MAWIESLRQAAQRRVAEQEERVARQAQLVANLKRNGLNARESEQLLAIMEDALDAFRTSLCLYR